MTDVVNHPAHYTQSRFTCECITITRHMTFCAGNAFKYIWRHQEKNGVEDLRKAAVYLRWAEEDRQRAWLPTHGVMATVDRLVTEHVFGPLSRGGHPAVYQALVEIGQYSNFAGALQIVEQAIAEYECAPIVLPADQFDQLMSEADQADIATRLAEAAVKPRMFRTNGVSRRFGDPGTYLINGCDQECSGNPDVPYDAESGNFPNVEAAS